VLPALLLPFVIGLHLHPAQGAYREVLASRAYFLVTTWHWWEWFGALAPLVILTECACLALKSTLPAFSRLAKILVGLGLISVVTALLLASDTDFAYLLRLQPMRSFHLIYGALFILLGGLLGEYLLCMRPWRWVLFFGPSPQQCSRSMLAAIPRAHTSSGQECDTRANGSPVFSGFGSTRRRMQSSRLIRNICSKPASIFTDFARSQNAACWPIRRKTAEQLRCSPNWLNPGKNRARLNQIGRMFRRIDCSVFEHNTV
jgi:hypothetical protein